MSEKTLPSRKLLTCKKVLMESLSFKWNHQYQEKKRNDNEKREPYLTLSKQENLTTSDMVLWL